MRRAVGLRPLQLTLHGPLTATTSIMLSTLHLFQPSEVAGARAPRRRDVTARDAFHLGAPGPRVVSLAENRGVHIR